MLRILSLGDLQILIGDQPITEDLSRKARALLVYLVLTGQPQPREVLADLLWDDRAQTRAMGNLRTLINSVRKHLDPYLTITRQRVGINPEAEIWLDAIPLENGLKDLPTPQTPLTSEQVTAAATALAGYQGDFLAGFSLKDGLNFDEWSVVERERLHHHAIVGGQRLVRHYLAQGDYPTGITLAQRLTTLDPLDELNHRQLMLLLARSGQINAALAQYDTCRQVLADELGVAPAPETNTLAARVRTAKLVRVPQLPVPPTPLIGREQELADILQRLTTDDCRLLTIIGTGGIGKTRLALQATQQSRRLFLHGAYYIPLAAITEPNLIVPAIAQAMQFQFYGRAPEEAQLLNLLREREVLLFFDNFEHLLPAAADLLAKLLEAAAGLKVLVTSRERLNLRTEWLYTLRGLPYPIPSDDPTTTYAALTLFSQCAARVQPEFALDQSRPAVIEICRLVEGLPLGIELAAAGLYQQSPSEIAQAIASDLDALAGMRDMPTRHRSIRAVFDYSWAMLPAAERTAHTQLAVFRGGFTAGAAQAVVNISAATLTTLSNKSLLRYEEHNQRYEMHELLAQFSGEHLAQAPDVKTQTQARHAEHYLQTLASHRSDLRSAKQLAALQSIETDLPNIRLAWQWAAENQHADWLLPAESALYAYIEVRSQYQMGFSLFSKAAAVIPEPDKNAALRLAVSALHVQLGRYAEAQTELAGIDPEHLTPNQQTRAKLITARTYQRLGEYETAHQMVTQAQAEFAAQGDQHGQAECLIAASDMLIDMGQFQQALENSTEALRLFRELGNPFYIANALNNMGTNSGVLGKLDDTAVYLTESLTLSEQLGDRLGMARAYHNLSNIAYFREDFDQARELRERSLNISREIGFQWGITTGLKHLGDVARQMGDFITARQLIEESLAISRAIQAEDQIAFALLALSNITVESNELDECATCLAELLDIVTASKNLHVAMSALIGAAHLWFQRKQHFELAWQVISFVKDHPATDKQITRQELDWQVTLRQKLGPRAATAEQAAKTSTFEDIVALVRPKL